MADLRKHSSTSNLIRFTLKNSSTGVGLTGLSSASAGLIIGTICDNEATTTAYTQAAGKIETIAAIGTFATPTATKCRFIEVDATNHKGLYEFQFDDARFSVANSKRLVISVTGATSLLDADYEIQLVAFDPYAATNLGLSALPTANPGANGGLPTTNGTKINQTVDLTVGQIAFKKNVAFPNFGFPMYDSTGALKTGLTVTVYIRKDAGNFAVLAGGNPAAETNRPGWYTCDFVQADTNATVIEFSAEAPGANPTGYTILTQA